jgi:hypothetical protein
MDMTVRRLNRVVGDAMLPSRVLRDPQAAVVTPP